MFLCHVKLAVTVQFATEKSKLMNGVFKCILLEPDHHTSYNCHITSVASHLLDM